MPAIDFAALAQPVSDAEACGPDLDLAGDPNFMNFMANAEGLLPESFFAFDRATVDFDAQFAALATLLSETRDLRLLATCAKLLILNRDLGGFAACIAAIAGLLQDRWDEVHPRLEDGDASLRMAPLQSLDDMPTVILPLQYVPLVQGERQTPISYRSAMIASGEVKPRQGEQAFDTGAIDKALDEAELGKLIETRDHLALLRDSLRRIRTVAAERAGYEQAVSLERLPDLAGKMLALVEGVVAKRDPSAALQAPAVEETAEADGEAGKAAEPAAQAVPRGRVRTVEDAAAALAAVAAYFGRLEPSSPALLLVRQAQQLIGKSFYEVLQILVPGRVDAAQVSIGSGDPIVLPLQRLSQIPPVSVAAATGGPPASGGNGEAGGGAPPIGEVRTRPEAVGLLEDVGAYYRTMEPSSPIPLLTDRARSLVERDFASILKDLLAQEAAAPAKK
jgi:type VI secretion system protein ImpA